ncbi:MAG: replicative DNA helicase, partial [Flavobacteriia bacterium]|nr:replicative DNA helicase [Flavobacteriia bacterium]
MEQAASTPSRARRDATVLPLGGAGRIPPQAIELEEAVLGALLIDRDALSKVVDILAPESFYVEAHQHIFEAVTHLFGESDPIDILTVAQRLRKE